MKTQVNGIDELPVTDTESKDQDDCEDTSSATPCTVSDIPQQSWQLAIAQDQSSPQGNAQPTLVAYPATQRQQYQPAVSSATHPVAAATRPVPTEFWRAASLSGGAQVIPQIPAFLNFNNNASRGAVAIPSVDCSQLQRPALNYTHQVVEVFKQSGKKEMMPSDVYIEMEKVYPYYKYIVGQRRKSWMSSVRHALTTSRFRSRKITDEDAPRRGCLWSLNPDFDETAPTPKPGRRRLMQTGASRRKQRFLGLTRNDYTPPLFHVNRNNAIMYQQQQQVQAQQQVAHRFPFLELPNTAPMQTTFSPGPTGPVHGGGNMYYQPFRSPTVGYVIAGQKMPMQQQPSIQPVNMGQWNVSGFTPCNQQQPLANNAAFYGGSNAVYQQNNQNNNIGLAQTINPAMLPALFNTNPNNNNNVSSVAPSSMQAHAPIQPRPISIQPAQQQVQAQAICDEVQQIGEQTNPAQAQGFLDQQSESQVHDDIKKELRDLVYESLDMVNAASQRSSDGSVTETASAQVKRSPTWAKPRPPHHAQGGFHNYAWSPLSHDSKTYRSTVETDGSSQDSQGEQEGGGDCKSGTETIEATVIEDLGGQVLVHASISNEALDQNTDAN